MFGRNRKTDKTPDLRPVAVAFCDQCGVPAGVRHELSCDEVSIEVFNTFVFGTDQPATRP